MSTCVAVQKDLDGVGNMHILFCGDVLNKSENVDSEHVGVLFQQPLYSEYKRFELYFEPAEPWQYGQVFQLAENLQTSVLDWGFPYSEGEIEEEEAFVWVNGQKIDLNSLNKSFFFNRGDAKSFSVVLEDIAGDPGFDQDEIAAITALLEGQLRFWAKFKDRLQYNTVNADRPHTLPEIEGFRLHHLQESLEKRLTRIAQESDFYNNKKKYHFVVKSQKKQATVISCKYIELSNWVCQYTENTKIYTFDSLETANNFAEKLDNEEESSE